MKNTARRSAAAAVFASATVIAGAVGTIALAGRAQADGLPSGATTTTAPTTATTVDPFGYLVPTTDSLPGASTTTSTATTSPSPSSTTTSSTTSSTSTSTTVPGGSGQPTTSTPRAPGSGGSGGSSGTSGRPPTPESGPGPLEDGAAGSALPPPADAAAALASPDLSLSSYSGPRSSLDVVQMLAGIGAGSDLLAQVLAPFPVAGPATYHNDFLEERVGGIHQGVDIVAPRATPVIASTDGTFSIPAGDVLGGISGIVTAANGDYVYYAHLQGYRPGLSSGDRIRTGEVIGYVGETGDAVGVHLHFEVHRAGGAAVSPVPYLDRWLAEARGRAQGLLQARSSSPSDAGSSVVAWSGAEQGNVLSQPARAAASPPQSPSSLDATLASQSSELSGRAVLTLLATVLAWVWLYRRRGPRAGRRRPFRFPSPPSSASGSSSGPGSASSSGPAVASAWSSFSSPSAPVPPRRMLRRRRPSTDDLIQGLHVLWQQERSAEVADLAPPDRRP